MGQGITITRGFGWVVDKYDGDYAANLGQFIDDGAALSESVDALMKSEQLDVTTERFGYDFASLALVARPSMVESYDWYHDLSTFAANRGAEPQYQRELAQALDALGWDEAGLDDPKWLLLVTYA